MSLSCYNGVMDSKQRQINKLRRLAERQTLSVKDQKARMKAAGIVPTLENQLAAAAASDAHCMSGRCDPDKFDRWIARHLKKNN